MTKHGHHHGGRRKDTPFIGQQVGPEPKLAGEATAWLPGGVYFATHSPVWHRGRAFYDAALPGQAAARGWLISTQQFADITAQEIYREGYGADHRSEFS